MTSTGKTAPFGSCITNSSGRISNVDADFEHASPFNQKEYLGQNLLLAFHPDDRPLLDDFNSSNPIFVDNIRVQTRHGWMRCAYCSFALDEDRRRHLFKRISYQKEIPKIEPQLRSLIENLDEVIIERDEEDYFLYVSESVRKTLGYSPQELLGTKGEVFLTQESAYQLEKLREGLDTVHMLTATVPFKHKDGSLRWAEVSGKKYTDQEAGKVRFVSVFRDITISRSVKEQLSGMETRAGFLFKNNPIPMLLLDTDTMSIIGANDAASQLYGYTIEEFSRLSAKDIRPKEDVESALKKIKTISGKPPSSNEMGIWRHIKKNGDLIWVRINIHTGGLAGEKNVRLLSINNVTDLKIKTQALIDNQHLLNEVFESSSDVIATFDLNWRLLSYNSNYSHIVERIEGLKVKPGMYIFDKINRPNASFFTDLFNECVKQDKSIKDTVLYTTDKGGFAELEVEVKPLKQESKTVGIIFFSRDITELKHLTYLSNRSNRLGRMGGWEYNLISKKLKLTDPVFDMLQMPRQNELDLDTFLQEITPRKHEQLKTDFKQLISDYHSFNTTVELSIKGAKTWFRLIGEREFFGENALRVRGFVQDITQQHSNERALKRTLKEKDVLLAEIHHRVKNNFSVIVALLGLHLHSTQENTVREALQESQHRIQSMALVHEKLYQTHSLESINFTQYIRELVDLMAKSYPHEPRHISFEISKRSVNLDITKAIPCGLIINEFISNSLKHAFKDVDNPIIQIKLSKKGQRIRLIYSDNGCGFEPEKVAPQSLGMALINMLRQQLDATIETDTKNGVLFSVSFKA